jgi:phosphoglycerol transferase MdoB-like AlkP superfamily enzyme
LILISRHNGNSACRVALLLSISLFLILAALKTKLYLRFRGYIYSNGIWSDLFSLLFSDFALAVVLFMLFYFMVKILRHRGPIAAGGIYVFILLFSAISTITYLRLGAPINAGMIGDIKYEFLKSSIEQTTDLKLLIAKLVLILIAGILLPYFLKMACKKLFTSYVLLISTCLVFLSLSIFASLKANRLGEPDLWKTPIQSFMTPILVEFRQKLSNNAGTVFSFDSPFNSKDPRIAAYVDLPPEKHNVIIYFMEGIPLKLLNEIAGAGHMPNVSNLLDQSFIFPHYYPTADDSTKGIFSLLTSMYPFPGYKKMTNITGDLNYQSLPKILGENGYNTAIVSSGSFEWDHVSHHFKKHFQISIDRNTSFNDKVYSKISWGLDDQFIVDQLDMLLASKEGPYFIILVPTNTHHPYLTPDKNFALYPNVDSYAKLKNAICYQDHIIGKINGVLRARGIANNTITIFTSDHSIRFNYDKGIKAGKPQISPGEEQNAIPLLIHHPLNRERLSLGSIGSHLDIAPTVLRMLGLANDRQFQGANLFQKNVENKVHFISGNVKSFNIILRDAEYQYFYDISNNREAIRYKNLTSEAKEYSPAEFPVRSKIYKQMSIDFINFQRQYLYNVLFNSPRGLNPIRAEQDLNNLVSDLEK